MRLDLGLRREGRHHAAVEQILRAVDDEAVAGHRAAGVDAAAEPDAAGHAGVDGDVEEVVAALEVAERLARRHQVRNPPELLRLDVVQTADLVPSAARQARDSWGP